MQSTPYTKEELKKIQGLELGMLKAVIDVCERLNIEYFLDGGTALGAVRHGGFIPWDDDVDLAMTRDHYMRFISEAQEFLPEEYTIQTSFNCRRHPYTFCKVRAAGTKFVEYCNRKLPIEQGVYIDIFPFDEAPDDERASERQHRRIQRLVRLFSLHQSHDISVEPETAAQKIKSLIRRAAYYAAQIIPYDFIIDRLYKEVTRYNGTGQKAYALLYSDERNSDYILKSDLYPLRKMKFEDIEANLPCNYDAYLRSNYGDYRKLPPEEQRCGHKPYLIDLGGKT